ncbi:MAG: hypothetical protein PHI97_00495 [Desulfobulbus sp.]|nr:hypothetical protein [Desulfobulbus sp.]
MNRPDKVVITITPDGECLEVFDSEGNILSSRSTTTLSISESRANQKGDIFDDIPEFEQVATAIEDISLDTFEISTALLSAREDEDCD